MLDGVTPRTKEAFADEYRAGDRIRAGFLRSSCRLGQKLVLVALCPLFIDTMVAAQSPDASTMIRRSQQALHGRTGQGEVSMTVLTPDWQHPLQMNYWAVNPDKTFIRVTAPAKEAGSATLRLGSNMWNYLPSVERVIKIPPSLMLQSWLGSDFTNDDLVRESSLEKDYDHKLAGEAIEGGDAEIKSLTWGQIHLDKGYLQVGKSKTAAGEGRTIPINSVLRQAILERRAQYEKKFKTIASSATKRAKC